MISWRIHTEAKNIDAIISETSRVFPSASFTTGIGLWKNSQEDSLTIEVIGDSKLEWSIKGLADWIKFHNEQQAILVTAIDLVHYNLR